MDSFYTPPSLADFVVSSCKSDKPKRIVDFAAGDGALLKSALVRWPDAKITAMDVDEVAIRTLTIGIPDATLRLEDFFLFSSARTSAADEGADASFDVILLNPPFSCRGSRSTTADVAGRTIHGSRALTFVARALAYMRDGGELIAILPSSCLTSERDSSLRMALGEKWEIEIIGDARSSAFPRCSVTIEIVRVTRRTSCVTKNQLSSAPRPDISRGRVQLMRGTIAAARGMIVPEGFQFVHSTDLIRGVVAQPSRWVNVAGRTVVGTALLLPRVGRPKMEKVVLKTDPTPVVLSDCVVALKTPSKQNERGLHEIIRKNWQCFSRLYVGSCAPYLTMRSLARALEHLGFEVEQAADMATDQRVKKAITEGRKQRMRQRQRAQDESRLSASA